MSEIMNEQYLFVTYAGKCLYNEPIAWKLENAMKGCRTLDKPNVEENVSFCDWFKSQDFLKPLK